jgi:hypothetical protein
LRKGGGGLRVSAEDLCCEEYQRKTDKRDEHGDLECPISPRAKSERWGGDYHRYVDQDRDESGLHAASVAVAIGSIRAVVLAETRAN